MLLFEWTWRPAVKKKKKKNNGSALFIIRNRKTSHQTSVSHSVGLIFCFSKIFYQNQVSILVRPQQNQIKLNQSFI